MDESEMAKASPSWLPEVYAALRKYEAEVERAGLEDTTKRTYLLHARNFVRWLDGDFTPGARK
jgi:hypothetical protein